MMSPPDSCKLCGLPIRSGAVTLKLPESDLHFCCIGCKQVYIVLSNAVDAVDPDKFQETELFKKCVEMGVIPSSEADLSRRTKEMPRKPTVTGKPIESGEPSENALNLNLQVMGMWCPACAWVIEKGLESSKGVFSVFCNFSTDRLRCRYDPVATTPNEIIRTVSGLGYHAAVPDESQFHSEKRREFIRFAVSAFLTLNVMMLSFALYSGFFTRLSREAVYKISFPIWVMASVVLLYGGKDLFRKTINGITMASPGMETLVCIGALSAYGLSMINFLKADVHLYFDTASMLITLVLLGKTIERHARNRVLADLNVFFNLQPTKVRICTDAYPRGRYANIEQLLKGDNFRVDSGETVPADGVILKGDGSVDESFLTGESRPIRKRSGDRMNAGAMVADGAFTVSADGVGNESVLGRMIAVMARTLDQKAPIEGKTDVVLKWFVPAIVCLAVLTGIFCKLIGFSNEVSVLRAITVMVISCPCALGIAIPMARVAGISLARRKGLLVRDFSAFEQTENIDTFVFDKTGTMTAGRWTLLEIRTNRSFSEKKALQIAAGLETVSDHYIALEIKTQANARNIEPDQIMHVRSDPNGISGYYGRQTVKIGSKAYMGEDIAAWSETAAEQPDDESYSRVYLSVGGCLKAVFIFGDEIKQNAPDTVEALKRKGFRTTLVSGDGAAATRSVGRRIGITDTHGGKFPAGKVSLIEDFKKAGHRVAMVGDGFNDAPALAAADLAISVRSGYNLNQEASHITLMRGDPAQIPEFLDLAVRVNRKINQNLLFSLIYNIVSIPVAMSGVLTPLIAVSAMLLSSLTVICNTLLLVRKEMKH